jgi:prevent-host-death family protein
VSETVNIHEAKTHLSRLLERVRRGQTITIAKAGAPIALLVPTGEDQATRRVRDTGLLPEARPGHDRAERLRRFLEQEVWPLLPPDQARRGLTQLEEDGILGYGPHGA